MNPSSTGQIRRSQVITTYGPGALIDLPRDSAIVAGVDGWKQPLERLDEPRLGRILSRMTGVLHPELYVPPDARSGQVLAEVPQGGSMPTAFPNGSWRRTRGTKVTATRHRKNLALADSSTARPWTRGGSTVASQSWRPVS